jgi:predicted ArsR family transcriptional regulator
MMTSRQRVLEYIRSHRYVTSTEISRVLKMTPANARHHLAVLEEQGAIEVVSHRPTGGKGRPAKVFSLTSHAVGSGVEKLAGAALDLLDNGLPGRETDNPLRLLALYLARGGEAGVESRELSSGSGLWRQEAPTQPHLTQRLYETVSRLNALGYAARWEARSDAPRIILGHCPYSRILDDHPQLCQMDEFILESLLQAPVRQVAKLIHDMRGAPYCMFRVDESHKPR